jgi:hypothetical protein
MVKRESRFFPHARPTRAGLLAGLRLGLAAVRRDPPIRAAVLPVGGIATFGLNFGVLLPVMARDVFKIGSSGIGLFMASAGLGSVTAGATGRTLEPFARPRLPMLTAP